MNFRGFSIRLLLRILRLHLPSNNKLPHIILLRQSKEFANLAGSFGTKSFRLCHVGDSWEIGVSLLDDYNRKNREIGTNDAAAYRFAFTFTCTAGTVTGVAFGEEETDTSRMENTLDTLARAKDSETYILHGEALFVVAAGNLEDVAFEFISN